MLRKRGTPTFIELLRNRGPRSGEGAPQAPLAKGPRPSGFGPSAVGVAGRPASDDHVSPMLFVRGNRPANSSVGSATGSGTGASSGSGGGTASAAGPAAATATRPAESGRGPFTISIEPKSAPQLAGGPEAENEGEHESMEGGGGAGRLGMSPQRVFMWVAAVMFLVVIVWYTASWRARSETERQKQEEVRRQHQADLDQAAAVAAALGGASPAGGNAPAGGNTTSGGEKKPVNPKPPNPEAAKKPEAKPSSGSSALAPSSIAIERLEKGYNYLIVATLMRKDADEAAKYLTDQGVPIAVVPSSDIDPADPRTNNPSFQWWVMVLRGYSGAEYGKSQTERTAIDQKVKKLGRAWKIENKRAPNDFSQGFWSKYAGS